MRTGTQHKDNPVKKTLMAAAATLACIGAAHAQSQVQVSGLVDMYVGSIKAPYPGSERVSQVGSGGLTTSWWGFNGTEDLGNGHKVGFNIEAFFRADEGTPGRFNGDAYFARNASLWIGGDWGTVRMGRSMAPNFLPTVLFNAFGDSFAISPLVLHANMNWPSFATNYRTTAADTGWSNQLTYSSPSLGGLKANVHYQFGEQAPASHKKNVGANLMYSQGPLALTAFIERAQVTNPTPTLMANTKQNWMLGGSYNFGPAKVYATYGQSELKDTTSYEADTTSLSLDVPVSSAGTIKAAVAYTSVDRGTTVDVKRTTFTAGYDHFLSKRTDVYTAVMYDRFKESASHNATSVVAGVRHRF